MRLFGNSYMELIQLQNLCMLTMRMNVGALGRWNLQQIDSRRKPRAILIPSEVSLRTSRIDDGFLMEV